LGYASSLTWAYSYQAGELHLYPIPVKTESGEKLELQVTIKNFYLSSSLSLYYFSVIYVKLLFAAKPW
jgi:hypothetical protein